ncbi:hypothetical protein ROZALSC1DRAFT_27195 [Rozella allomycis CSF55]|uniref:Uncharacterized protein n=1 Tax=Rozella allomycis (strain CSF55) TaxID=988480 RepID=A0A075AN57_ROZAC|nr:hypothetical protein O9G_001079 [Rozella allomycis CSF55]RKP21394.1 hypothetical protein ROZALSC1DRAFT_27195 [Rozella allomycis CSF55]|eukprot:EPZ31168.1 hypothetical protein O9G_001079 [Rozella allomycis CSF55]
MRSQPLDTPLSLTVEDKAFIKELTSGPVELIVIAKNKAAEKCPFDLGLCEETNISIATLIGSIPSEIFYAPKNAKDVERDISFFFKGTFTDQLPTESDTSLFMEKFIYPSLSKGLTQLCKEKPADPAVWLGNWLLQNNPRQPIVEEP